MTRTGIQPKRLAVWAVVAILGLALPVGALASTPDEAYDAGWSLRFYLAAVDFNQTSSEPGAPGGGDSWDINYGGGVGFNAEYRFSRHLGIDLGVLAGAGVDIAARTVEVGQTTSVVYDTVSFTPVTTGLDIHLTPEARVDVYLCPTLAWVRYGGMTVTADSAVGTTTEVDFDDDLAAALALGLGVPFGNEHWSLQANVTYMDGSMSGSARNGTRLDRDYDMTLFKVGFGYRF